MSKSKLTELENRLASLEAAMNIAPSMKKSSGTEKELACDLDKLMQKYGALFSKGLMFTGIAIPSQNPRRLVRWSGCGGFKSDNEFSEFIERADSDVTARFSANFSSPEKLKIIKTLIRKGPMGQREILASTELSQGQFYHHLKDLLASRLVEKMGKDQYDLSEMGHVLSVSFIGIVNAFAK